MEDLTGKQLGTYQIVAPLGEGGMASIYKAYQPAVDRHVALKILPRHFASDPKFVARFEQEAKIIAKLQHPHIRPVHDFGQEDGYTYIVMTYIEGGTLSDLLTGTPTPMEQIRRVISQIGDALDYAHCLGVVHRDVKPSNILVDKRGNCLLTDFGIAKMVEGSIHLTQTGTMIGTPAYMSPEQIQGHTLDGRSDVYSLGIVLYEMATGRPPYQAETPPAIFIKHVHDPLPPPRQLNPSLPGPVEAVVQKSLAKQPEDRYASAADMVRALQATVPETVQVQPTAAETLVAEPAPVVKQPLETVKTPEPIIPSLAPHPTPSGIGAKRVLAITGAAIILVGIIVVAVWFGMGGLGEFKPNISNMTITKVGSEAAAPTQPPTKGPAQSPTKTKKESPTEEPTPTVVVNLLTGGCQDPIGCVVYEPGDPIRIASALVISGPNTDLGTDAQYGVEIAIDFQGEIMGHTLELQAEDDGCNAEGGQAAGQKIVSDPTIIGVVGTSCSGAAGPMMGVISEAGYVMVSPSNTSPVLTDPDQYWQPGYLRTAHNDQIQGLAMAEFAFHELGITTAAAIHDGDPYTEGLARVFADSFVELGGTVTNFTAVNKGDTDMRPVLNDVAADSPQFLYYPVFTAEGGFLTKQAREVTGLEDTILASADGMISSAAAEAVGPAGEGMYFSGPDLSFSGQTYERFIATYREKYGSDPISIFHAHAFDAANMIFACIQAVAGVDDNDSLYIGRQALRDCLYATSGFTGITGTLTCNEYGDCADPRISVSQLQNGEYVRVWP